MKASNSNGVYSNKSIFQTEDSNGEEAIVTWLSCQRFTDEADLGDHANVVFTSGRAEARECRELTISVKLHQTSSLAINTFSVV